MMRLRFPIWSFAVPTLALTGLLWGCSKESSCKNEGPARKPQIQVRVTRLENEMDACTTRPAAEAFLQKYPAFLRAFVQPGFPDTAVAGLLVHQAADPHLDTLLADVRHQFPGSESMDAGFSELFSNIKGYFPAWQPPHVYTLVSGFSIDLNYLDTSLFIGLEHFTNDSARFEPPGIPRYIKRRLQPNTVVANVALILSDRFNQADPAAEAAMLDEMLRWGKAYYFLEKTIPCLPDSIISGYSGAEMAGVNENQKRIYDHFVERHLFFEKDRLLVSKYTGERPNTPEIGDKAPGRLGRWMGWQIVRRFAEEKKMALPEVMRQTNARQVFDQARWRPE